MVCTASRCSLSFASGAASRLIPSTGTFRAASCALSVRRTPLEPPFVVSHLQETVREHGLDHLRVRKHGDLIIIESEPKPILCATSGSVVLRANGTLWKSPLMPVAGSRSHSFWLSLRMSSKPLIHNFLGCSRPWTNSERTSGPRY